MATVTLSRKNQIVIPREAREALGLRPGDKLTVVIRRGMVLMQKEPASHHADILGLARRMYPRGYLRNERQSWE